MIKAMNLNYSRGGKCILDNININIEPGSFVAVIGHNGSGKSTLVRHFNALLAPSEGAVLIDGMDTADKNNIFKIRQRVGMVFQNPESQSVASIVEDDVAFGPENLGLDEEETLQRMEYALSACGIDHLRMRDISSLSKGQKQLVAIAGIIAMQPKYMVFDEAVSMLDPQSKKLILNCVMKLKNELKISIIWITHDMEDAVLADRVVVLDSNKIVADDTPDAIFSNIELIENLSCEMPNTTRLCMMLKNKGYNISHLPLDIKDCALIIKQIAKGANS